MQITYKSHDSGLTLTRSQIDEGRERIERKKIKQSNEFLPSSFFVASATDFFE
jgi:hypothetical protein